jgi:enamine deaminase RidA (YjgF/YER057c/UK114 family)
MAEFHGTLSQRRFTLRLTFLASSVFLFAATALQAELQYVEPDSKTGSSAAVVVGDQPLVHTTQLLPSGSETDTNATEQIRELLDRLDRLLRSAKSGLDRTVKLNVYVSKREVIALVRSELARRFAGEHKPAVAFVVTPLPNSGATVAVDAVATTSVDPGRAVRISRLSTNQESDGTNHAVSIVPAGTRIYVSGQAARSESLAEATRGTLEQLHETLKFLGRRPDDILQVKCFLQPMEEAAVVQAEIKRFFGTRLVPPVSLVEWQSGSTVPIEIEIVAFGGANRTGPVVEYLTPPGMKASPVFSLVTRINHSKSIYVSGLYPAEESDETIPEVEQLFSSLDRILKKSGSDLRHLVKATYYVSADHTSKSLNELRPKYYDPARPPAASKAKVADVGQLGAGITIDMIAVPAIGPELSEYGPAEFGHGLTKEDAAAGWISLFDGTTAHGWTGAVVKVGLLSGGRTNSNFQVFEVRAKSKTRGLLRIGKLFFPVDGAFTAKIEAGSQAKRTALQLGTGLQIEQLAVRPIQLKAIFDGTDISDWIPIAREGQPDSKQTKWSVNDGIIRAVGGSGCLEYVGGQFGDFVLQLDVRTRIRHVNGGVFFRAIRGDFMNGYEAQIFNRSENGDPSRPAHWSTGGIDDRQNARRMVSRDGEFFRMTIIADGPHIATWVNGHQQVDWTDTRELQDNPRMGRREKPGVIQLQAHDPETDVEFRRISIGAF